MKCSVKTTKFATFIGIRKPNLPYLLAYEYRRVKKVHYLGFLYSKNMANFENVDSALLEYFIKHLTLIFE